MNNLLFYLMKWRPWILFAIYVVVSCSLLFEQNPYQHSVYLTSANSVASGVYNADLRSWKLPERNRPTAFSGATISSLPM